MKCLGFTFLLAFTLFASAQTFDNKFALLIDGKAYGNGAYIGLQTLNCISDPIVIIDSDHNISYKPISFECVVSIKDSNSVWKFAANQVDIEPVHCKNCCKALGFKEIISRMKPNDIIAIDQIQYPDRDGSLPKQFLFKVM